MLRGCCRCLGSASAPGHVLFGCLASAVGVRRGSLAIKPQDVQPRGRFRRLNGRAEVSSHRRQDPPRALRRRQGRCVSLPLRPPYPPRRRRFSPTKSAPPPSKHYAPSADLFSTPKLPPLLPSSALHSPSPAPTCRESTNGRPARRRVLGRINALTDRALAAAAIPPATPPDKFGEPPQPPGVQGTEFI